jgi:hypothetical protein
MVSTVATKIKGNGEANEDLKSGETADSRCIQNVGEYPA